MIGVGNRFTNFDGHQFLYEENLEIEYHRGYRNHYILNKYKLIYDKTEIKYFPGNGYYIADKEEGFDVNLIFTI